MELTAAVYGWLKVLVCVCVCEPLRVCPAWEKGGDDS